MELGYQQCRNVFVSISINQKYIALFNTTFVCYWCVVVFTLIMWIWPNTFLSADKLILVHWKNVATVRDGGLGIPLAMFIFKMASVPMLELNLTVQ